jgi:nitrogen fixation/metabolism regulation signal transduction histidine kinase
MAFCLLVIVFTTVIYGIFLSHKMAGPIYRIKTELRRLASGEPGKDAQLRKNDEFTSVITEVNAVKKYQRQLDQKLRNALNKLEHGDLKEGRSIIRSIIH